MKKPFFFLPAIALSLAIVTGCATTSFREEPKAPDRGTLLIGQVQVEIKDWPRKEMNGVHRRNVQVYLYDNNEKKRYQITSHGDGVFYVVFPDEKKQIFILGFVVKGNTLGGTNTINVDYRKWVDLYAGKVNNVGRITATVQTEGIAKQRTSNIVYDISQDVKVDYENIRQWFQKTFPESAWNNKEWVDIPHK